MANWGTWLQKMWCYVIFQDHISGTSKRSPGRTIWYNNFWSALLFFIEREKASKVLSSGLFRTFYSFCCSYLEFIYDLPRNGFTGIVSQGGIFVRHLENNYCDNFRSSAKKLSNIFKWLVLSSVTLEVQNFRRILTALSWSLPVSACRSLKHGHWKGCGSFSISALTILTPKSLYFNSILSIWRNARIKAERKKC